MNVRIIPLTSSNVADNPMDTEGARFSIASSICALIAFGMIRLFRIIHCQMPENGIPEFR